MHGMSSAPFYTITFHSLYSIPLSWNTSVSPRQPLSIPSVYLLLSLTLFLAPSTFGLYILLESYINHFLHVPKLFSNTLVHLTLMYCFPILSVTFTPRALFKHFRSHIFTLPLSIAFNIHDPQLYNAGGATMPSSLLISVEAERFLLHNIHPKLHT